MARTITLPATTASEDIVSITEYPGRMVRVGVALVGRDGLLIDPNRAEMLEIKDADFTELMSANPTWAPGKPDGTYRNEDLWHFIDKLRSNKNA